MKKKKCSLRLKRTKQKQRRNESGFSSFSVASIVGFQVALTKDCLPFSRSCQSSQSSVHRWYLHPLSLWYQLSSPICYIFRSTCLCFFPQCPPQISVVFLSLQFFYLLPFLLLCRNAAQKLGNRQVSSVLRQLHAVLTNVSLYSHINLPVFSSVFSFLKKATI